MECNDPLRLAIVEQSEISTLKSGDYLTCLVSYGCVETDESFGADRFTRKLLSLSKLQISRANCSRLVRRCDWMLSKSSSEDYQEAESGQS